MADGQTGINRRDEQITRAVNAVIAVALALPLGRVLTWEAIEEVTGGFNRQHRRWSAFRKRLMRDFPRARDGVVLFYLPENPGGWTVLTPEQQIKELPRVRLRRAAGQLKKTRDAVGGLEAVPPHLRRRQDYVLDKVKEASRAMKRARKALTENEARRESYSHRSPLPRP